MRLKPKNVVQLAFAYAKVDEQYVPETEKDGHVDEDVVVAFKLVRTAPPFCQAVGSNTFHSLYTVQLYNRAL